MKKKPLDTASIATVANRPGLYLIYLLFFFIPMSFQPVGTADIVVAIVAVVLFVPLHFLGFNAEPKVRIATIGAFLVICVGTAPFVNSNSVFFIYAVASAAFLRPMGTSAILFVVSAIVYVTSAWAFDRHLFEICMAMLLAIIIWVSCYSSSEAIYENARAERARALDMQQASLIERERIARDLHDLLGHTLTLVSVKADLVQRLLERDPERAMAELSSIQTTSREALSEVRATLSGLTVTTVASELENARSSLQSAGVALTVLGPRPDLEPEQDTAFGLMLREAVTNIIRHSSADQAEIRFAQEDDVYSLEITDNGQVTGLMEGSGLRGLRARLERLGGMLSVKAETGVQLRALLPT